MKMKRLLAVFFLCLLMCSTGRAELMKTAGPLGQGNWRLMANAISDQNFMNVSGAADLLACGVLAYGVTDQLDLYGTIGSGNATGLPAQTSLTALSGNFKYNIMKCCDSPVALAIDGGYKGSSSLMGTTLSAFSQWKLGVIVSKMIHPFIPYGGLIYRSTMKNSNAYTSQYDVTVGVALYQTMALMLMVEDTYQTISPTIGNGYGSNQIAVGISGLLN